MTEIEFIESGLKEMISKMESFVNENEDILSVLHHSQKLSAVNLMRYLILRNEDIRTLQDRLHNQGLSSLASSEGHILCQLQMILRRLGNDIPDDEISSLDHITGKKLISQRSREMFGSKKTSGIPFLMVTFDSDFADNYNLVKKLLLSGMNIARINTAHDDEETWEKMISNVKAASEETGIPCRIYRIWQVRSSGLVFSEKEGKTVKSILRMARLFFLPRTTPNMILFQK